MTTFSLRKEQKEKLGQVLVLLRKFNVCYLIGEVRTGKTHIALMAGKAYASTGYVLFLTKKKAIKSIKKDNKEAGHKFRIVITNYEQLLNTIREHGRPVFVILDEAHVLGSFPKPAKKAKEIRKFLGGKQIPMLLMSGTPTPESEVQIYHQFWCTGWGPWQRFTGLRGFYKFAKEYVDVQQKYVGAMRTVNDYSKEKPHLPKEWKKFQVSFSQQEAGFNGIVREKFHYLPMPEVCRQLIRKLRRQQLSLFHNIVADSAAKLMMAIHQISSGTYIDADGERHILSDYKIKYIKRRFAGKKIAIYYVFIAEGEMLKKAFKNWTDSPEEFNKSKDKVFICQIVAGREGVNLSTADDLIFFNISFSAVSYWQGRARTQTIDGGDRWIHWIMSKEGIEGDVYDAVRLKQNYTKQYFDARKYNSI
jgi:hypothetical protein